MFHMCAPAPVPPHMVPETVMQRVPPENSERSHRYWNAFVYPSHTTFVPASPSNTEMICHESPYGVLWSLAAALSYVTASQMASQ